MESANSTTYDDFEPYCKWERHDSEDVLIVHLPDFKRNELKIQINKYGIVTVSGQCQTSKDVSKTTRFNKRIKLSSDYYDEEHINAKFVSGILYITIPHRVPKSKTSNYQTDHTHIENLKNKIQEGSRNTDVITDMALLEDVNDVMESVKKRSGIVKRNAVASYDAMCKEMSYGFGSIKSLISDGDDGRNVAVMVASVVAVSSLGAYVVYKLWSGSRKT